MGADPLLCVCTNIVTIVLLLVEAHGLKDCTYNYLTNLTDTEEEEETDDNAVSYRTNAIRIALDTEKLAMAKIMAAQMNTMVLNKTVEPMHSHRSRHRE